MNTSNRTSSTGVATQTNNDAISVKVKSPSSCSANMASDRAGLVTAVPRLDVISSFFVTSQTFKTRKIISNFEGIFLTAFSSGTSILDLDFWVL
ncbi:MAG: hypothetical protein ACI9Y1_000679 [Lentisphaeria bacterium]|jgi:hypothetical protein